MFSLASATVLVITAGLLFWMAATDLRDLKIRNELVLVLAGLYLVYALFSGRWVQLHWNIGFALVMFAIMLPLYAKGLMGGGDLKLLTTAFLWTGPFLAVPFLFFLSVFALLHTVAARTGWVRSERPDGRLRVAFAPSVAAGLIGVFVIGLLKPV